jgi:hypothetical protein
MESEPNPELLAGLISGMEADRDAVLATMRQLLLARLAEDELTPEERLQAKLLLREIDGANDKA